jgi:hypothetical protein
LDWGIVNPSFPTVSLGKGFDLLFAPFSAFLLLGFERPKPLNLILEHSANLVVVV